ncbi:MAG: DUF2225 domain-containing protein [Clostridiales bacterium]|jgi:uncharacterized protein (DUF2225 family)|nr:DUF2225 domain-containing protein [Clostridiales bacterium]
MDISDIFNDLHKFGLKAVASRQTEIFVPEVEKAVGVKEKEVAPFNIDDYVYEKKFRCPVCEQTFTCDVVKESKIKVQSIEFDLRPICVPVDPLYYGIVVCNTCGYSAVNRVFDKIMKKQAEKIIGEIAPNFVYRSYPKEPEIDMVIDRYKLALLNAVVKQAKDGEKAYICMKLTWLYRIKGNEHENELKFAKLTVSGFNNALAKEYCPILGLEEGTILCLLGAFQMTLGDNASALKILSSVITSNRVSHRLKDRARDLKSEMLSKQLQPS